MVNYEKSVIYKLCCKDIHIQEIYIGSTTNFSRRKNQHKTCCNNINGKSYNYYVYNFIREHGGFENWDMILIENYACENKKELEKKERECIELCKSSLNKNIPTRTGKEWNNDNQGKLKNYKKKYYNDNEEKIKIYQKEYYNENEEKIKKYRKEYLKEYHKKNKDKIKDQKKVYQEKNKNNL